jgi:hypothetical protein
MTARNNSSSNTLKPIGHYTYHMLKHTTTLHSARRVYFHASYGSHNKKHFFPSTALTGDVMFPVKYELNVYIYYLEGIQPLKGQKYQY